jgi:hypothetical protein
MVALCVLLFAWMGMHASLCCFPLGPARLIICKAWMHLCVLYGLSIPRESIAEIEFFFFFSEPEGEVIFLPAFRAWHVIKIAWPVLLC